METTSSLLQGQPISAPLIEARNVSHFFGEGDARSQVLFDNTFQIHPGQLVIMTGPSGSGKTTLLTLIGALRAAQVGHLEVLGQSLIGLDTMALTEMRRQIGFIFQMHNLFESLTALENVVMATHLTGMPLSEAQQRGTVLLERLGLGHRLHHRPSALSGGQRQRVAVARALVCRPRLILADEPTAALDKASSREVVNLLNELAREEQCAIVMVTHDNRIVDQADRIMSMIDGRIVSDVQVRELVTICELLAKSNFFAQLNTAELSAIAEKMQPRKFVDGEALVRQGDIGEEFFLIAQGHTDVLTDQGGSTPVASLSPGQYFGERALLTGETRNATVVGRGNGLVYTLGKDEFQATLKVAPDLREQLQKLYFSRC